MLLIEEIQKQFKIMICLNMEVNLNHRMLLGILPSREHESFLLFCTTLISPDEGIDLTLKLYRFLNWVGNSNTPDVLT